MKQKCRATRSTPSISKADAAPTEEATSSCQQQEDAAPMATTSSYGVDFFTSMVSRVLPPDTITMDALAIKPEALDDARAALAELPVKHYNEKEARRCQLEEQFPLWAFQLSQGFSVLLYGFGSKRRLLDAFLRSRPPHHAVISVDGRAPGLTARQVLLKVAHEHGRSSMAHLRTQPDEVLLEGLRAAPADRSLVLGVHNIDGLPDLQAQSLLSELAAVPSVQLIASVDHVDAALLWDKEVAARFNWLWHDATTFAAYTDEVAGLTSVLEGNREGSAVAAATKVLQSLVPNAQKVFRVLLDAVVDSQDASAEVRFADLFKTCRDAFLVQNEITLRAHLTEFKDHLLVVSRRAPDGVEYLGVPFDYESVLKLYEQIEIQLA